VVGISEGVLQFTEGRDQPSRNAAWYNTGSMSLYTSPSTSRIATSPASLGSGHPDCIEITSGSSISMLGMAIATVMNRLRETGFGYGDYKRRSSLCSLVLLRLAKESLPVISYETWFSFGLHERKG